MWRMWCWACLDVNLTVKATHAVTVAQYLDCGDLGSRAGSYGCFCEAHFEERKNRWLTLGR